ncbi:hypothetical protein GVN21_00465 [Caulobacter sp. SLTY]|uniref:hypothetical protein n=1 Tax=Caulobacter sp. SLTY TaxID=2683262 RepID=UPI0014121548|nr:hypothetical protein [Caulobacter sp. SLTY]NBB13824.1 hypothetical protein [Caulobacter sp. SLTY]
MRTAPVLAAILIAAATPAWAGDVAVGQIYECDSPDSDLTLTLVVGRIDHKQGQTFISVSMFNDAPDAPHREIGHTPFVDGALEFCTLQPGARALSANFEEGYAMWREAFDEGGGGAFDEAPADTYEMMLEMTSPDAAPQPGRNDT